MIGDRRDQSWPDLFRAGLTRAVEIRLEQNIFARHPKTVAVWWAALLAGHSIQSR